MATASPLEKAGIDGGNEIADAGNPFAVPFGGEVFAESFHRGGSCEIG
jgi:hypothetical protein